ncbi:MAG: TolC family protein [Planctomycetaceae bacterium]
MKKSPMICAAFALTLTFGCTQYSSHVRNDLHRSQVHDSDGLADTNSATTSLSGENSFADAVPSEAYPQDFGAAGSTVTLTAGTFDDDGKSNNASQKLNDGPLKMTTEPVQAVVASEDSSSDLTAVGMSVLDFETLALSNNPSIRELAASTQKAAGYRYQVGLRANPIVGYQGQQLADQQTDQHLAFFEQEFVTADKLALNRCVLNETLRAQLLELEAQKLRVATDVRVKFYEALAAQKRIRLISEFRSVTDKGVEIAELRNKLAEGSRIDVLQATVQKNEIDLAMQQAQAQFDGAWRGLVALTGSAQMQPTTLIGDLPTEMQVRDWEMLRSVLVSSSPEYSAAQARISRARSELQRHNVQPIPNLTVQFGAGVDNATNSGMMNVQLGAPIPLFNKNEGNIAAAHAEFCRASLEAQRIEKSIEARLADVSRDYDSSLAAVNKYNQDILPNAAESLKLAELAYEAGETSFVQVLVARRTYFDSNLQFIQAQTQLAQAGSRVDGYVLTGGLDAVTDDSGDDSLRGLTFGQQ